MISDTLKQRLRETAFLTKNLRIVLLDREEKIRSVRKNYPLCRRYQGICHLLKQEQRSSLRSGHLL